MKTVLPEPFDFWPWVEAHAAELDTGKALNLFEVYCSRPVCRAMGVSCLIL